MLTKCELASVLAGLRLLQEHENLLGLDEIATDGGSFERLTAEEIDALCESINGAFAVFDKVFVDASNVKGEGEVIATGPEYVTVRLNTSGLMLTVAHDNVYPREPGLGEQRKPLTVEKLRAALDGANPNAVVALCADDFTYSAFVETIDSTQTDKGDGDVGQFLLRLDATSEVGRFLSGE